MFNVSGFKLLLSSLVKDDRVDESDFVFEESYPLSKLTSFRTGGNAAVLFFESQKAVKVIFPAIVAAKIPYFLLGNGTNVIAKDEGFDGVILSFIHLKKITVTENMITAESGALVTTLASVAQKAGLSGMETLYGIPGSVGGAVFMNAGAYGGECKDTLVSVTYVTPDGKVLTRPTEELEMGYRTSVFENTGDAIISATFCLGKKDPAAIRESMDDYMSRRVAKQPLEYPSAGSTFKRCEGRFTAQMIDEAGLKGYRIGGAMVSEKHAGFIINFEKAKSADIFSLIDHVKRVIFEKEGISIECEVRVIE